MNTIVNVTGIALKCLETSDEKTIKKQKIREYKTKYYILNKEKINQYLREWYKKNKEKIKKKSKERYLKNKEIVSKKGKEYYLKNKERVKQNSKEGYLKNKEKYNQRSKEWSLKNKEKHKQLTKKWYLKNAERVKQRSKEWVLKNKEKHKQSMKRWYSENKIYIRQYIKKRREIDPIFKMISNIRRRILSAIKGKDKSANTMKLLGADVDTVWKHLESTFKPGMTKENHGLWHIDHIRPCASFDLSKPGEQAKCFHYTNLQALWAHENFSKGDRFVA